MTAAPITALIVEATPGLRKLVDISQGIESDVAVSQADAAALLDLIRGLRPGRSDVDPKPVPPAVLPTDKGGLDDFEHSLAPAGSAT